MPICLDAWSEKGVDLTAEQAEAVGRSGLVRVLVDRPPERWRLVADSRVGVVQGAGWEVRVSPRLRIPRLMFLLGYASDPRGWREVGPSFAPERDLFAAVANGFSIHAARSLTPAPLHGYVTVQEHATTLRGRLRTSEQIARWAGMPLPLELEYDDFTADVPENRLVLGAAESLLRFPRIPHGTRLRLRRVRAALEGVTPAAPGPDVSAPPPSRLNTRYRSALALAELILRGSSVSTRQGAVTSIAFLFDMNRVFENFLSATLRDELESRGGTVRLQHGIGHLDREEKINLVPDITWWRSGRCHAVIDAKYKALGGASLPNADAYQMLAYATALGLERGYLVYAKDADEVSRMHTVSKTATTIDVTAVDVEREPDEVLAQVRGLAARITASAFPAHMLVA